MNRPTAFQKPESLKKLSTIVGSNSLLLEPAIGHEITNLNFYSRHIIVFLIWLGRQSRADNYYEEEQIYIRNIVNLIPVKLEKCNFINLNICTVYICKNNRFLFRLRVILRKVFFKKHFMSFMKAKDFPSVQSVGSPR